MPAPPPPPALPVARISRETTWETTCGDIDCRSPSLCCRTLHVSHVVRLWYYRGVICNVVLHNDADTSLDSTGKSINLPSFDCSFFCLLLIQFPCAIIWAFTPSLSRSLYSPKSAPSHCAQLSCVWRKRCDWQSLFKIEYAFLPAGLMHAKWRTFPWLMASIYNGPLSFFAPISDFLSLFSVCHGDL